MKHWMDEKIEKDTFKSIRNTFALDTGFRVAGGISLIGAYLIDSPARGYLGFFGAIAYIVGESFDLYHKFWTNRYIKENLVEREERR